MTSIVRAHPDWRERWDDDELAEKGVPCMCGHDPDRHERSDDLEHVYPCPGGNGGPHDQCRPITWLDVCLDCDVSPIGACPGQWVPDRERLCEACRGHGGDPIYEYAPQCDQCNGSGWTA